MSWKIAATASAKTSSHSKVSPVTLVVYLPYTSSFLAHHSCMPPLVQDGFTALIFASFSGNVDLVRMLMGKGAGGLENKNIVRMSSEGGWILVT